MPPVPTRRIKTIRALQPNAGVATWYAHQLAEMIAAAHADLTAEISRVWPTVPTGTPRVVQQIAQDAGIADIRRRLKRWGDRWSKKFDELAPKIAKQFAAKNFAATQSAFKAALREAGMTVRFQATRASLDAFRATVAENVGLIRSIPEQYLTQVQTQVWQAVTRGSDMATLSVKLRKQYGVTERRAALIARDQNRKAKATIEQVERLQLGITEAVWMHSSAGKEPRPTHVALNNKVFDLKKGAWDSDEKEWVLPGQLINCRCSSRAVIPGLKE